MTGRLLDGRYRIGPRIARGGMASVYEATDVRLDRTVAVKVMHPGLGDDAEFAARFVREARSAARLSHPNVVGVYDQGEEDGTVYLAMELIPGHTLRDVIRKESPLPPARALALMEPVLSALATAHRAGLIHRDVKPENVLIADDGRVKVADFGLARAVSADTHHTATGGVLIGTVSYLAPELVVDGRADARADVYAAGVVLFELLTGAKPHEGESPIQVAYKHVHEDVPPPSGRVPEIPGYVDALVARATARDRGLRPADAGVLLHQMRRVSHALAEGVREDPELTADLAPTVVRSIPAEAPSPDDTDPFDAGELRTLLSPAGFVADADRDHTARLQRLAEPPPPAAAPTRPPDTPTRPARPRRSRRGPLLLALALLLAVSAGVGAWWFGFGRYTSTPGVIGLTRVAADQRLEGAGLEVRWGEKAYSETVAAGRVISTDPDPGSRVLHGGTVTVVLSLGKERYDVPRLAGQTVGQAQDALRGTHLAYGRSVSRWSGKVPKGVVIRSDPPAGTSVRADTPVNLVVSAGPKPIDLAELAGKPLAAAKAWLRHKGLKATVASREYSDNVPAGHVISQDPTAGSTVHRGDEVSLVVSKGPQLVEMPRLIASGVDAARQRLHELGFKVRVEHSPQYIGLNYVLKTDPGAGEMVPKGSTVTLYLI